MKLPLAAGHAACRSCALESDAACPCRTHRALCAHGPPALPCGQEIELYQKANVGNFVRRRAPLGRTSDQDKNTNRPARGMSNQAKGTNRPARGTRNRDKGTNCPARGTRNRDKGTSN